MKATLFQPSGHGRVLHEQELCALGVQRPLQMGLPVLCADIDQAARVLGFATAQTVVQSTHFVAYAGLEMLAGVPYQFQEFNPVAGAHLRTLGMLHCQPCPIGPVLVIETAPVAEEQQVGQSHSMGF